MIFPPTPNELLHILLTQVIQPGDYVIDATAGNGYDTLFLAKAVGENGKVLAVDLQAQAIESTKKRLESALCLPRVRFYQGCHSQLAHYCHPETPRVILFNLGYLPGADHQTITQTKTTLEAINAAASLLEKGGFLSVVCYPGHEGGDSEAKAVETLIEQFQDFRVARYSLVATRRVSPFLLLGVKLS